MTRSWAALAALLLASPSLGQSRRTVAPLSTNVAAVLTVQAAPLIPIAPLAPPAMSAYDATKAAPSAEIPETPAPVISRSAARAAAIRAQNAASRFIKPPSPEPAPDFGSQLFDGKDPGITRSGTVFSFSKSGSYFFVAEQSPKAAPKTVDGTRGLVGAALLNHLSEIVARDSRPEKERVQRSYGAASHYLFSVVENHLLKGVRGVTDAYSGIFVPGTSGEGQDYSECNGCEKMNVEHVFPQSLFGRKSPMVSDIHILMASMEKPNAIRGRLPFGKVKDADYKNKAGARRGDDRFEPPDFSKGRVARKMLYFFVRYRDRAFFQRPEVIRFWNSQVEVLLNWNRRFPATVEEARQNDHEEKFQGNRNPFVDDDRLADKIGEGAFVIPPAPVAPKPARRISRKS